MYYRYLLILIAALLHSACSSYSSGSVMQNERNTQALAGRFALKQQIAPPSQIQSVQLYPSGSEAAPPVIKLNGSSSLTLAFDDIGTVGRQFKLSVSHREKNWGKSSLVPRAYLNSFFETTFGGGQKSSSRTPTYFHYSYSFLNKNLNITKSGNYLLSVFDYHNDKILFRIPFFVSEDKGTLQTRLELLFAQHTKGRTLTQPFSVYKYPDFIVHPRFDLSFFYVQNHFWGRARRADFFDTASPGEVDFHLGRNQSFIRDYEFNVLDIRSFRSNGRQIIDLQSGKTPPVVTLRRDIQQFNKTISRYPETIEGPLNDQQTEYGKILFSLETNENISAGDAIYLVGDFNNWMINDSFRMHYNSTAKEWKGQALIKQGRYAYKYVLINNHVINDLALDRGFTNSTSSYLTFIYFQDPDRHFDRLLQIDRILSR